MPAATLLVEVIVTTLVIVSLRVGNSFLVIVVGVANAVSVSMTVMIEACWAPRVGVTSTVTVAALVTVISVVCSCCG
jgi:hypothetical protein